MHRGLAMTDTHQLVITGGDVLDGTGVPARRLDVGITDGLISALGLGLQGGTVIDATGLTVAPGFIDVHTHYDAQVFWDPALTPSCWHGVTTVVAGNCGFSIAPCRPEDRELLAHTLEHVEDMPIESLRAGIPWNFETYPEYLDAVEQLGTVLNFGGYVGHTAVRMWVMGGEEAYDRAATEVEVSEMRGVVGDALRAGALGFSTSSAGTHQGDGGRPVPSRRASLGEVTELALALRDESRGVGAFLPGEAVSHEDVYRLQPEIGRPFTWTALVTMPGGFHERLLQVHDKGRAAGGAVWPQVSVRPVVFQVTMAEPFSFQMAAPFSELMAVTPAERVARYRDPSWRVGAFESLEAIPIGRPRWDAISVGESDTHPELCGRPVAELAAEQGVTPLDVMLDLALAEDLATRFTVTVANDDVEAIAAMLPREDLILGLSDAGAHVGQLCDAVFATELLGLWVRERGALTLERAVRKLTGEVADLFELPGRGYLRVGAAADVTVFDPATVTPGPTRRVADFPGGASRLIADQPEGIVHVLVNGVPIRLAGEPLADALERRPGMLIRSARHGEESS